MSTTVKTFDITKAIEIGIKYRVIELMPAIIDKAKEDITKALNKIIDEIALEVLQQYTIERRGSELHIIVSKGENNG